MSSVKNYIARHFRHFNAAVVVDAARAWDAHLKSGGKMFLSMAGAMSTAELGLSLAELIRQDKIHGLCVTGANIEEDLFNLVAREHYVRIPHYRDLRPEDELALLERGLNRVTDTCIPEEAALKKLERHMLAVWQRAERDGERYLPHEFYYQVIRSGVLDADTQIDRRDSWLVAASEKNLPIWVPGWEDSTMANVWVALKLRGELHGYGAVKSGLEQMESLVHWYVAQQKKHSMGFFQIGGGIAGDFLICVVPLIDQELRREFGECRKWRYFCQISDSTTSYGSYSGAVPNEKITWAKLDVDTPSFVIESDATIVFPLIAAHLLDQ